MNILVIFAHPSTNSMGHALFEKAVATLEEVGHDVQVLDLYRLGFDPVLSPDEWDSYIADTDKNIANVKEHVELLQWAEGLVFVFPTWYYGVPAILKGWFERVWLPGVTFEKADTRGKRPIPKLQKVRSVAIITTSGSPKWWIWIIRDPLKSFFKRGLRPLFALRCKYIWCQLYDMNCITRDEGAKFIDRVGQKLRSIR